MPEELTHQSAPDPDRGMHGRDDSRGVVLTLDWTDVEALVVALELYRLRPHAVSEEPTIVRRQARAAELEHHLAEALVIAEAAGVR